MKDLAFGPGSFWFFWYMMFEHVSELYMLGISLVINIVLGCFILYTNNERKRIYKMLNAVNNSISEKNQAITEQAAKLSEAYESLWKINQRLEEEVQLRTNKIRLQHKKLIEYTHFNTHKIRGPLASILGLLVLAQKEDKSKSLDELLEMINLCARELDDIVRDFTQKLNDDL